MLSNPIEEAKSRFSELTKVMDEADKIRPEWLELKDFLAKAQKLFPKYFEVSNGNGNGHHEETPVAPKGPQTLFDTEKRRRNPTSKMATEIFKAQGPQSIAKLLNFLYQAGWQGSNDTDRDARAVYNALSLHPEMFRNLGGGAWDIRRTTP
jgi:hypothetical protein